MLSVKKNKNYNWKPYIVIVCLVSMIMVLLIGLGLFFNNDNYDFLGYIGAIIGGGLTLLGVCLTIIFQSIISHNELAVAYRPLIKLEGNAQILSNEDVSIIIPIKNIGRGEALDVTIKLLNNNNITFSPTSIPYFTSIQNDSIMLRLSKYEYMSRLKYHKNICLVFKIKYYDLFKAYTITDIQHVYIYNDKKTLNDTQKIICEAKNNKQLYKLGFLSHKEYLLKKRKLKQSYIKNLK